jgi:hypothetical protein
MSNPNVDPPLATIFHGDVNIEAGSDAALYGDGSFTVYKTGFFGYGSSTNSTTNLTGSVISYGGLGVYADTNIGQKLTVSSTSSLQTTFIDTSIGSGVGLNVTGANLVNIAVGASVTFSTTSGTALVSSSKASLTMVGAGATTLTTTDTIDVNAGQHMNITSDQVADAAIIIKGTAGGIELETAASRGVNIIAGSNGIIGNASSGNVFLSANGGNATLQSSSGNSKLIANSVIAGNNVEISQLGGTDSAIKIISSGINTTVDAIQMYNTDVNGVINIHNVVTGVGSISNYSGSGGFSATTFTGGPLTLTANAANGSFVVNSTGGTGQALTLAVQGEPLLDGKLNLQSNGTNITQAILIQTTNISGGILISQPASSLGGVAIHAGAKGILGDTLSGGGVNFTGNNATSSFVNNTDSSGQDLTISLVGTSGSKLVLNSQGTGPNGIQINSNGTIGNGITMNATGTINVNADSAINIGTNISAVPINIGTTNSTCTVYGSLDVRGTTTTIESTIVQITDNIIQVNNGPAGTADGGLAIKRWQPANDAGTGDVVSDTAEETGAIAGASVVPATQFRLATAPTLTSVGDHDTVGYYNGWWIKITGGTGANQVRRIKSYSGTPDYIATIYTTAEQTTILGTPVPVQGMDITTPTTLAGASLYALFPCQWICAIWDESLNEYAIVCSNSFAEVTTGNPNIAHYVDLHVNDIIANNITATTINNTTADLTADFSLANNTTPLELSMTNLTPNNVQVFGTKGIYIVIIKPTTATTTRPYAVFIVGSLGTSTGAVIRLLSVKGAGNDQLDMSWAAGERPSVFYRSNSAAATFTMRIITV